MYNPYGANVLRQSGFSIAVAILLCACVTLHATPRPTGGQEVLQAKTVRAERFVLADKNGTEWVRMDVADEGKGAIIRFLRGSKTCVAIDVAEDRSSISLRCAGEKKSRVLLQAANNGAVITFEDEEGRSRGIVDVSNSGMGFKFFDSKGVDRGQMYFSEKGSDGIKLYDRKGTVVWEAPK